MHNRTRAATWQEEKVSKRALTYAKAAGVFGLVVTAIAAGLLVIGAMGIMRMPIRDPQIFPEEWGK